MPEKIDAYRAMLEEEIDPVYLAKQINNMLDREEHPFFDIGDAEALIEWIADQLKGA